MAEVTIAPVIITDAVIKFGGVAGDDYAAAVNSVTITPSSSTTNYKGLKKNVHTFPVFDGWVMAVNFAQDWVNPDSLSHYLFANRGEKVEAVVEPQSGEGTRWTLDVWLAPGVVGGTRDGVMTSDASFGVDGDPVPTAIV
jgi:hypothetical protein